MKKIEFVQTKDGNLTCSVDGKTLHSKYNPLAEATRFVDNLNYNFIPQNIVITEPGLCYILKPLKEKFLKARIISVHYEKELFDHSSCAEKLLVDTNSKANNFSNTLLNLLGEEGICSTLFISWTASSNIFNEQDSIVWYQIKEAVQLSHTLLATRTYFTEKWFLNSLKLIRNRISFYTIKPVDKPIVICASGPSLKDSIPFLKERRNKYFLIAVSSACKPLLCNDLMPDLVISSDGGYWAKKHLECLRNYPDIPLVLACEGNCPTSLISETKIIPLCYPDGYGSKLFRDCGIKNMEGCRNGTVSGTALDFAKKLTYKEIFMCGLDLSAGIGLQHTGPNANEILSFSKDNKLITLEKRQTASRYNTASLKIYENWFSTLDENYTKNVFRLSDNYKYSNKLGNIIDINFNKFDNFEYVESKLCLNLEKQNFSSDKLNVLELIEHYSVSEEWKKEFFSVDFLSFKREIDLTKKNELSKKLETNNDKLLDKIKRAYK